MDEHDFPDCFYTSNLCERVNLRCYWSSCNVGTAQPWICDDCASIHAPSFSGPGKMALVCSGCSYPNDFSSYSYSTHLWPLPGSGTGAPIVQRCNCDTSIYSGTDVRYAHDQIW